MGLDDILYTKGIGQLRFVERPLKSLEIFHTEEGREHIVVERDEIPPSKLDDWLQYDIPVSLRDVRSTSAFRLLYQEWDVDDSFREEPNHIFPLAKEDFEEIIARLHLPLSYPFDFMKTQPTPTRLEVIQSPQGKKIGIVFQSPRFYEAFMTFALSYDPSTNTTVGYLGHTTIARKGRRGEKPRPTELASFLSEIKTASDRAIHPMLLPALALGVWSQILRKEHTTDDNELKYTQRQTGLMKGYFLGGVRGRKRRKREAELMEEDQEEDLERKYAKLHEGLVEQHAHLTGQVVMFLESLIESAVEVFTEVTNEIPIQHRATNEVGKQILTFIDHMVETVKTEIKHRDRMLHRLDMQLKVLYNLMQQRDGKINYAIALEARRDTSAMKSIAMLTFIFLPGTAVATIFAMNPFFGSDPTLSSFITSPHFWLYWAVTIPLTFFLLVLWFMWMERREIMRRLYQAATLEDDQTSGDPPPEYRRTRDFSGRATTDDIEMQRGAISRTRSMPQIVTSVRPAKLSRDGRSTVYKPEKDSKYGW